MTVRELLSSISSRELVEWAGYERVSGPLGPERQDIHMAIIASTMANANSKKKFTPKDFMPKWDRKRSQSDLEQQQLARTLAARGGGTFTNGENSS